MFVFGAESTDQKNYEYEHFLHSDRIVEMNFRFLIQPS